MGRFLRCLALVAAGAACLLAGRLQASQAQGAADVDAEKQWMNDAADAQEDVRESLANPEASVDFKGVSDAALKIEGFMARTEAYWASRRADDIVKLAQTARAESRALATAAAARRKADAAAAFAALSGTCNSCHDLHPEKR